MGNLFFGFGVWEGMIGFEFGFGVVVGEDILELVLLIKIVWGGKSLVKDFCLFSLGEEIGEYYE